MAIKAGPEGLGYRLRPVERRDAAKILELRTDPELGRFLNPTVGGVETQEVWIEAQRARAGDYYFVVEMLSGHWEGVIGLYGIEDASGVWGRWILRRGSLAASASVLLLFGFGFDQLKLRRICCETYEEHVAAISFHDSCKYTSRSELIDTAGRRCVEYSLDIADWPEFRESLAPAAERVARRGARL
ncbi:GNAT family N-acetyltransferase [Mycobacterium sp.]|uniref:GNAT family N-acetyltransferase n=1 Tax=Mycobacterium sp. TaxID=1785 RepID=UPI003F9C5054